MTEKDQIPWTTIQDKDREEVRWGGGISPHLLAALVAAQRTLMDRNEFDRALELRDAVNDAIDDVIERYVHVRGTGAILEGDHNS